MLVALCVTCTEAIISSCKCFLLFVSESRGDMCFLKRDTHGGPQVGEMVKISWINWEREGTRVGK